MAHARPYDHETLLYFLDRAIEVVASFQHIQDRYSRLYHNLLWQYHWYIRHDCKRKD